MCVHRFGLCVWLWRVCARLWLACVHGAGAWAGVRRVPVAMACVCAWSDGGPGPCVHGEWPVCARGDGLCVTHCVCAWLWRVRVVGGCVRGDGVCVCVCVCVCGDGVWLWPVRVRGDGLCVLPG